MSVTNLFNFSRSLPAPFDTLRNKKVKVSSKYGSGMESTLCSSAIKAIHALCRCMDGSSEGAVGTIDNRTVAEYKSSIGPDSYHLVREDDAYNNFRIHLIAKYGKINNPMKMDVTTGDVITPAAIRYDYPLILSEKTVSILAYSLETILAEKYETIIRRNIGTTRARDFYDLYMLCRQHWDEIRFEVLHDAVQHTAKKRGSLEELYDWKDILKEIREEPQLYTLWRNYVAENKYAEGLEFHVILDIVDEIAEMLNF